MLDGPLGPFRPTTEYFFSNFIIKYIIWTLGNKSYINFSIRSGSRWLKVFGESVIGANKIRSSSTIWNSPSGPCSCGRWSIFSVRKTRDSVNWFWISWTIETSRVHSAIVTTTASIIVAITWAWSVALRIWPEKIEYAVILSMKQESRSNSYLDLVGMVGKVGCISGSRFLNEAFQWSSHLWVSVRQSVGLFGTKSSPLLLFTFLPFRIWFKFWFGLGLTGPIGLLFLVVALLSWFWDRLIPPSFDKAIGFGTNGSWIKVSIILAIWWNGCLGSICGGGLDHIYKKTATH